MHRLELQKKFNLIIVPELEAASLENRLNAQTSKPYIEQQ